jgi:hypothetical protein
MIVEIILVILAIIFLWLCKNKKQSKYRKEDFEYDKYQYTEG